MTGRGRGFCVLKLTTRPGAPVTGLAGWRGWPVGPPPEGEADLGQLRTQARRIEAVLRAIRGRLERLETSRRRGSGGAQRAEELPQEEHQGL